MKCRTAVAALLSVMAASAAFGAQLPNFDALALAPRVDGAARATVSALAATSAPRLQWHDRFGVPTFVWVGGEKARSLVASTATVYTTESAARSAIADYASLYGLDRADIDDAYVSAVHDIGRGAVVVKLRQRIGGIDIFREEMNVALDRSRDLIALSGQLSSLPRSGRIASNAVQSSPFLLSAANAIAAVQQGDVNALRLRGLAEGGYQVYDGADQPIRIKQVYFHLPGRFEPAYYFEATAPESDDLYSYVVSALDGRLLFRKNLVADDAEAVPFAYRVWARTDGDHVPFPGPQGYDGTPSPTGDPDGYLPAWILPNIVTLSHGPISTGDAWLAASATQTTGNNADAYADLVPPDGFTTGDVRAGVTAGFSFDRTYDVARAPGATDQQMAAITQLFYDVNFMHDWYYDAGFNEAAGNAQADNYGRGGVAADSVRAEADDFSGRNNANMLTPADGASPRMQMYVWDDPGNRTLRVVSPSSIAGPFATGVAVFGLQSFDITNDVVRSSPLDGCTAIATDVAGKIAFIDRGGTDCTFLMKVRNAQAAGAVAVIVGNVPTSATPQFTITMGCPAGACVASDATLPPVLLLALADADALRSAIASGLRVTMRRDRSVDRDGTIDNQIVAHEWMHYMSNRLIGNGNGLESGQARALGEGWSDFNALLLTARPEDTRFSSNASFGGAYAMAVYSTAGGMNGPISNNGVYFGIRRLPYSTDMTKNPLTLKHVRNGVPIDDVPVRFGADGTINAEVHNTGEVWCTMLWEAYTSLLRDTIGNSPRLTFAEAQQRMREYLVASLKMTPVDPTILEARDALLAAAFARDKVDYELFWKAFGKRGAGIAAIAPQRYSDTNAGAIEDFNGSGGMIVTGVTVDDSIATCLPNGVLDGGESGAVHLTLRNVGGVRLAATTVRLTSSDAALTFTAAGMGVIPPSNPGETVTTTVPASLSSGAHGILQPDITIAIQDPQIPTAGGMKSVYEARLNAMDAPKETATDDVEAGSTAWTFAGVGNASWSRVEQSPREHHWFASEPRAAADISLVSPPLMVAPTGDFRFSFHHRFALDFFVEYWVKYVDGAVIEITADDGKTWRDIGDRIDPSSTGYGDTGTLDGNHSAIEGRRAFQGLSPGFDPNIPFESPLTKTVVNLGTDYAGQRVRIRFRLVTGAVHTLITRFGWTIDDIAFENILNLPFAAMVADQGTCGIAQTTTLLAVSERTIQPGASLALSATVSGAPAMIGTVDFYDNGAILGTARLDNGVARLHSALPAGLHAITAAFNGGKYFTASSSSAIAVQVGATGRRRTVH